MTRATVRYCVMAMMAVTRLRHAQTSQSIEDICHGRIKMADITMCTQTLCPNASHCYRVQAKASEWQSMVMFDYTISARGVECRYYMPIYRTVATESTGHNVRQGFSK